MSTPSKPRRILVVDDEMTIAKALSIKLEQCGYIANVAPNGVVALQEIVQHPYDLILLDLLMPEMDGWDVLKAQQGKAAAIFVTSNLSQQEDRERALALGAKGYIVKSDTTLAEIVDHIQEYFTPPEK